MAEPLTANGDPGLVGMLLLSAIVAAGAGGYRLTAAWQAVTAQELYDHGEIEEVLGVAWRYRATEIGRTRVERGRR